MLVKRIAVLAAYTHLSSTVYELYRGIGRKLQLFPTPLHNAPVGVFPLEFRESLVLGKLESWGYQAVMTV